MSALLPDGFAELEHLVPEWALASGHERYLKRVASSMEELTAFYDQVFPRGREAIDYLDGFDYGQPLPQDAANLLHLVYALITVALAVEVWKQPRVKHSASTILTRMD